MKIKFALMAGLSSIILLFSSCVEYPDGSDLTTEQLISISSFDNERDFSKYKTYAIPNYIIEVAENEHEGQHITTPEAKNALERIRYNLEKAGYQEAPNANAADLLVNVGWADITNVTYYPGGWWDYYDYWGWGWYYPPGYYPYYPPTIVSAYEVGLLIVEMAENTKNANNKCPIIWTGTVRGIKHIAHHSKDEVNAAIDDCFTQTPILEGK